MFLWEASENSPWYYFDLMNYCLVSLKSHIFVYITYLISQIWKLFKFFLIASSSNWNRMATNDINKLFLYLFRDAPFLAHHFWILYFVISLTRKILKIIKRFVICVSCLSIPSYECCESVPTVLSLGVWNIELMHRKTFIWIFLQNAELF